MLARAPSAILLKHRWFESPARYKSVASSSFFGSQCRIGVVHYQLAAIFFPKALEMSSQLVLAAPR